jgi:hypothetical protein
MSFESGLTVVHCILKCCFVSVQAATQLSKAALSKLDSSHSTLPRDTHTDTDVLHRLFSQPKWKVREGEEGGRGI